MNIKYRLLMALKYNPLKIKDKYFKYYDDKGIYLIKFILLFIFFYNLDVIIENIFKIAITNLLYFGYFEDFYFKYYIDRKPIYLLATFLFFYFILVYYFFRYIWRLFNSIKEISYEEYIDALEQKKRKIKRSKIFRRLIPIFLIGIYLSIFFIDIFKLPDFKGTKGYYTYSKNKEYMGIFVSIPKGIDNKIIVRTKDNTIISFALVHPTKVAPEERVFSHVSDWFNYKIEKSPNGEKIYIPISFTPTSYPDIDYVVKMDIPVPLKDRIYTWLVVHIKGLAISDLELIDKATTKW